MTLYATPPHQDITQLVLGALLRNARCERFTSISVFLEQDTPDLALFEATCFEHFNKTENGFTLVHRFSMNPGTTA